MKDIKCLSMKFIKSFSGGKNEQVYRTQKYHPRKYSAENANFV